MKKYVDFMEAGMFVSMEDGNTQEEQLEITPVVEDTERTETIIDKIGDNCEVGSTDSIPADVDFIDPELEEDIRAIEEATRADIVSGPEVFLDTEDPYNEVPGGVDLNNDSDEEVNGIDKIREYSEDVNEIEVTGTQDAVDEVMRDQYDQGEGDEEDYIGSITGPSDNQEELDLGSLGLGDEVDTEDSETEIVAVDEMEEDEISLGETLGTESDNLEEIEDEAEEVEAEEELEEADEEATEEVVEETAEEEAEVEAEEEVEAAEEEVEGEEATELEEEIVEDEELSEDEVEAIEEEEVEVDEIPEDSNCKEEYQLLGSVQVKVGDTEEEVELGSNSAFDEVSEMRDVNAVDGETQDFNTDAEVVEDEAGVEIGDGETNMSDVVGEMLAEQSHGEEDGYEEGDVAADGEGEYSEGEASYDDLNDTAETEDGEYVPEEPAVEEPMEEVVDEPVEEEEYDEIEDGDFSDEY